MATVKNYLSLIKFSHTIFAMPFALIGFVLGVNDLQRIPHVKADGSMIQTLPQKAKIFFYYDWFIFILVLICMISARSAAMAFNRYLDRQFDAKNPRTAIREIPKGIISPKNALAFTIGSCVAFVVACYFINTAVLILSPIALFVVLFYSYTKRFTALCHLVLGVGLSLAPIGAYLAVTGVFAWLPILFALSVVFWVSGFDIIYALQDEAFDKANKLHSIPAALGTKNALRVSELLHVLSAACVVAAGFYGGFHWLYWAGIAVFAGMLMYQHSIVKPTDLSKVNIAFMTANGIASVVFALFVISDLFIL
jgi:4-hydroxybenzoate polyprenyltransferase